MADREKVIKGLKCCSGTSRVCMYVQTTNECPYAELIEEDWCGVDSNVECTKALATDALELLKEQEPIRPILARIGNYDAINDYTCPVCGTDLYHLQKYCDECGRAVKRNA